MYEKVFTGYQSDCCLSSWTPAALTLIEPLVRNGQAKTSILVYGEVVEYLKGLPTFQAYKARLQKLFALNQITPYPLTYPILERYADFRRYPRPQHKEIGDIDTLIAATALEHNLTLLTIDTDYDRVPHLKWQLVNLKKAASSPRI
jgi:predicted nucleic acid-binding protein